MDERLKFIARLLDGEPMAVLCREFGISRKTGYKILTRYNEIGLEGLTDRSRRPYRHANQLPTQIETLIVRLKQDKPSWGAPKIRERLARLYPDVHTPAISTVHAVLDRHGLVKRRTRRRNRAEGTTLSRPAQPNELWCADYKGEFMLADRRYCYPLTITDSASRYIFACEALSTTKEAYAFPVFEAAFKRFGLPRAIRTDNGVPFASPNSLFNLSRLSVWWLRLGIAIERIKPGHPQQNGRHERMHLTLKLETTKPAGNNFLQQQAKFDDFVECFNNERPHQALNMRCPAECYVPSSRPYAGLPELDYPFHDKAVTVTTCGRICFNRQKINLSTVFAGQKVGIKQVSEQIWLVSFMDYDLGYFDDETCRLEPLENPFGPKVLDPVVTSGSSCRTSEAACEARAPHSAVASERLR
jgi:putative transposase